MGRNDYPKISIDNGLIKWDKLIKDEIFKESAHIIWDCTPPVLKFPINGEIISIPLTRMVDDMG